jgi:hypothetical protein
MRAATLLIVVALVCCLAMEITGSRRETDYSHCDPPIPEGNCVVRPATTYNGGSRRDRSGNMIGYCENKYDQNIVSSALVGNWTTDTILSERLKGKKGKIWNVEFSNDPTVLEPIEASNHSYICHYIGDNDLRIFKVNKVEQLK